MEQRLNREQLSCFGRPRGTGTRASFVVLIPGTCSQVLCLLYGLQRRPVVGRNTATEEGPERSASKSAFPVETPTICNNLRRAVRRDGRSPSQIMVHLRTLQGNVFFLFTPLGKEELNGRLSEWSLYLKHFLWSRYYSSHLTTEESLSSKWLNHLFKVSHTRAKLLILKSKSSTKGFKNYFSLYALKTETHVTNFWKVDIHWLCSWT